MPASLFTHLLVRCAVQWRERRVAFEFLWLYTYELLTVLALIATLAAMAIPSFQKLLDHHLKITRLNQIQSTIYEARQISKQTGNTVLICPSDSGQQCGGNWSDGYLMFQDRNHNRKVDSNEPLLKSVTDFKPYERLIWRGFPSSRYLQFHPDFNLSASSGRFIYCPNDRVPNEVGGFILSRSGRLRPLEPGDRVSSCNVE